MVWIENKSAVCLFSKSESYFKFDPNEVRVEGYLVAAICESEEKQQRVGFWRVFNSRCLNTFNFDPALRSGRRAKQPAGILKYLSCGSKSLGPWSTDRVEI